MIYLDNAATTFPKPAEVYNSVDAVSYTHLNHYIKITIASKIKISYNTCINISL